MSTLRCPNGKSSTPSSLSLGVEDLSSARRALGHAILEFLCIPRLKFYKFMHLNAALTPPFRWHIHYYKFMDIFFNTTKY